MNIDYGDIHFAISETIILAGFILAGFMAWIAKR